VTSRNGRTKLTVRSNALFQALMTLHPSLIATVIAVGMISEQGLGWPAALIGTGIMAIGPVVSAGLLKSGHRNAEKLADELSERIARSIVEHSHPAVSAIEADADLRQRPGQE
jgi:NhaP-type Na+/H+ or K+/H+ antiporter